MKSQIERNKVIKNEIKMEVDGEETEVESSAHDTQQVLMHILRSYFC